MQAASSLRRSFPLAVVAGLALLVSACGSDGKAASPTTAVETTAAETTVVETTAPDTTAVDTTVVDSTTPDGSGVDTTLVDAGANLPADAVDYDDPQGLYVMSISPAWVEVPGTLGPTAEFFTVQPTPDDFNNNVNILNQSADGRDLDGYLALSLDSMGDFEVVDSGKIIGSRGNTLGYIEYTGKAAITGDLPLHFLAVMSVEGDNVTLITLGATEDTFNDVADANAAYLIGLKTL
jgi:hypothetical protein